ncbi:MAG: hypothetical protein V8T45_07915 [Oscillospiraceae bacterium]
MGCFFALNLFYFVVVWVATWFINPSKPIARQNQLCRVGCLYVAYLLTGYGWVRTHVRGLEKWPEPGASCWVQPPLHVRPGGYSEESWVNSTSPSSPNHPT